jgi:hypothetical protein
MTASLALVSHRKTNPNIVTLAQSYEKMVSEMEGRLKMRKN